MTGPITSAGPTLVVLAAGASRRYGGLKQLEPLGPAGEALVDYAVLDAARAGFSRVLLVIRGELEGDFQEHFRAFDPALPLAYVHQRLPDFGPDGGTGRTKPLGTAHAVLAVQSRVDGPFAVVNADDFYGAGAYRVAAEFLRRVEGGSAHYAIIGYRLDRTLSPSGGVSRAVCETDSAGELTSITEVLDVHRTDGGVMGKDAEGRPVPLVGDEPVSMNFWAFTPRVFAALSEAVAAFVAHHQDDPEAELHLPTVIGDQVFRGVARVEVLAAGSDTFGVTHPSDRPAVQSALRELVARGDYPSRPSAGSGAASRPTPQS